MLESCTHHASVILGCQNVPSSSLVRWCASITVVEARVPRKACSFLAQFSMIHMLDRHDSTSIQLFMSSGFIPYPDQLLKVARKFLIFRTIQSVKAWSRPIGEDLRGDDLRFLLMSKKCFEMTYNLPMFGDASKITLLEAKLSIKVVSFASKTNRDSKSES